MSSKSKTSRVKSTAVLSTMVLLGICSAFVPKVWGRYSGGTGDPNDPYQIATAEDLNDIGNYEEDWDKHFILVNDVNLAGRTYSTAVIAPDVYNSNSVFDGKAFAGIFDGNDHKITGLTIDDVGTGNDFLGLFGCIGEDGQVRNLRIEAGSVSGSSKSFYVGGLVGLNSWGLVSNCYSTVDISGHYDVGGLMGSNYGSVLNCYSIGDVNGGGDVGGLVGVNSGGSISNCYSTSDISGDWLVGGLIGYNAGGSISNCYFTGDVTGNEAVGGLLGVNFWDGTVSNCYSTGDVSGDEEVGGLIGISDGIVSNCYSTGSVSGELWVGGLVGHNGYTGWTLDPGYISYSYSTSNVQGASEVGGLVGYNEGGSIGSSFWDIQTSGEPNMCGEQCGYATGCDPNCGKTTAEMKTRNTFTDAGWDFIEIWGIGENQTYPFLRTEPAGDSNHDKKVDLLDLAILASHWLEEK